LMPPRRPLVTKYSFVANNIYSVSRKNSGPLLARRRLQLFTLKAFDNTAWGQAGELPASQAATLGNE
jgi:hypothetical protein